MAPDPDDEDLGGDPACWLDRVCDACGALVEGPHDCAAADPAADPAPDG